MVQTWRMGAASREPKSGPSIRTRLLATIVALMTLGLLLAGGTGYVLERINLARNVTDQLSREAREFANMATGTVDPGTGQPFASASALLRTAIQQHAFAPADGAVGLVDGRIEWTAPATVSLRIEDDPQFMAEAFSLAEAATTTLGRIGTANHDFFYLVVPVRIEATAQTGALVRAVDFAVVTRQLNNTYRLYAGVAILVVAVGGVLAWGVMGRLLAPIARLRAAADSIGEHDLTSRIPVRGSDDLSWLTATINRMLDRIEGLVEGQRQLLDDVGHELRTPLTIIRGHLELVDPEDPDDVRATRQRALAEADRMQRLTDDLILLATSHPTDYVVPTAIDLTPLTDETFELARVLASRPWRLEAIGEATLLADPQRIRQAWLQLADNAVKYSPPGSAIGLGSEVRGDHAWLWVHDHGPGIDPGDRERILQRSVRGEAALKSGRGGRGLGLAIVSKIVAAHGGRLEIDTAPDGGSVVSMVLPVPTPPPGAQP